MASRAIFNQCATRYTATPRYPTAMEPSREVSARFPGHFLSASIESPSFWVFRKIRKGFTPRMLTSLSDSVAPSLVVVAGWTVP